MNDVKMDPMLSLNVIAAFSEQQECENQWHTDPEQEMYHDTYPAKWYMSVQCDYCQHSKGVLAVCDRFKRTAERLSFSLCSNCDKVAGLTILVLERIK